MKLTTIASFALLASSFPQGTTSAQAFVRGDANTDGAVNMSDAVRIFGHLFLGSAVPDCLDAADSDDSGVIDMTDGVRLLNVLFLSQGRIPAPYPAPGVDPTPDRLSCGAAPSPGPGLGAQAGRIVVPKVPGVNELVARSDGRTSASSDADGELIVIVHSDHGEGGGGAAVEVERLHLHAGSLRVGRGETGEVTCRRSSKGAAAAAFVRATGRLSASISVEISYPELLNSPRHQARGADLKATVLPIPGIAQLSAQVGAGGTITGTLTVQLPEDAPVVGAQVLEWRFDGPWSLEDLELDPDAFDGDRFRMKVGVVAQDAAGNGAVISQADVEAAIAQANSIWSQCCIQLRAGPAATATIEHIPADAFAGGDGDLFAVEDSGGFLGSDEQEFLWSYNDDPEAIEVVFVERFVVDGVSSFTAGVTSGGGGAGAAIIIETENLSPEWIGRVLAHEVGHALGIGEHSSSPDNLMYPELMKGSLLDEGQCAEAHADSPLPATQVLCTAE